MKTFLYDVLKHLNDNNIELTDYVFILPSKRAGNFLKSQIPEVTNKTNFAPEIISIEEFVQDIAKLESISNTELLFKFYEVYVKYTPKARIESFDKFSTWAQTLIQDFNEIDRYLIPQAQIFDYLKSIQEINQMHWSLNHENSSLIDGYLAFWNLLHVYYEKLVNALQEEALGYQGLIYRYSVEKLDDYIKINNKQYIFIGFNALNAAESKIIQTLLNCNKAQIFWDTDKYFVNNYNHDAGLFLRDYKRTWTYFKTNAFNWQSSNYTKPKHINVVGVPKQVGQAKYIGSLLDHIMISKGSINDTAVVLGDESLLLPVLNSIPKSIQNINVTMGLPLHEVPVAAFFDILIKFQEKNKGELYYKDIVNIIGHPIIRGLFFVDGIDFHQKIINHLQVNNLTFISVTSFCNLFDKVAYLLLVLFDPWYNDIDGVLIRVFEVLTHIKTYLDSDKSSNLLVLEQLYHINHVFEEINKLNLRYKFINSIKSFYTIYNEILKGETLDFKGEALKGLQIMGVLESRVIDFETVIISSVNEGVFPSGKSNNSFIPYDVKLENGLPTYKEKDAIYTYHFYRLLHRAKHVYILYNAEIDSLNGNEKSRFISQLEIDNIHDINHRLLSTPIPQIDNEPEVVSKTISILNRIEQVASKGFSPSSLTSYIRNPIDFYYQKILDIKEDNQLEEFVAANTFGSIIHDTLEEFYRPFINQLITVNDVKSMKLKVDNTVRKHFSALYKLGTIDKGKNLIAFEISKRYVTNFLNHEINDLQKGNTIKIIEIETSLNVDVDVPEVNKTIRLNGKVDRVDLYNGTLRIIDYKSGKVEQGQVEVVNWEDLITDYKKYSKSFQLLMYAYMMHKRTPLNLPVTAGIISFKNLKKGILNFSKKDKLGARAVKDVYINANVLNEFEQQLKVLIIELFNPNIDFVEKETL